MPPLKHFGHSVQRHQKFEFSGYLSMAEKRTDAAKQESVDSVEGIDDLDNLATPEMILLSAVR